MIINIQCSFWNALKVLDINVLHQPLKIMLNIMTCYFVTCLRITKSINKNVIMNVIAEINRSELLLLL